MTSWCTIELEGLVIHDTPSWEDYVEFGENLAVLEHALPMIVGDWLNAGSWIYGEKYTQAVKFTGRKEQTLMNWASVCNRVPFDRRVKDLHYSHYQAVMKLEPDEQLYWQTLAKDFGWSASELKDQIRGNQGKSATVQAEGDRLFRLLDKINDLIDTEDLRTEFNAAYSILIKVISKINKVQEVEHTGAGRFYE